jgi:hypothetical protein
LAATILVIAIALGSAWLNGQLRRLRLFFVASVAVPHGHDVTLVES